MSEENPEILVNGEKQQQQQQQQHDPAAAEEQTSSDSVDEEQSEVNVDEEHSEDNVVAEKEPQTKMHSILQQVRNQVRSQSAPKSSMLELVQKVKDREMQVNGEPEGKDVNSEEKEAAEILTDESKDDTDLCAIFDKKLEASAKALRDEFEVQISQVRAEMQTYTDQALKDLESKMQSSQHHSLQHLKEQQESKGLDRKPKPSAAPSLASRRGRVLTRTMTTIIPKTCAPVIVGPRAKSETLTYSKGESSRVVLRDPVPFVTGNKPYPSRKPPVPPTYPPLNQRKKTVLPKARTGN